MLKLNDVAENEAFEACCGSNTVAGSRLDRDGMDSKTQD